jgi:very-short-patch-repair endonuclease
MSNEIDVLNNVKKPLFLPNTQLMTIKMVADYYEVPLETIKTIVGRHFDELTEDGYEVYSRAELINLWIQKNANFKNLKGKTVVTINNQNIIIPNRGLRLFTARALLHIGILLRDSIIAEKVRQEIIKSGNLKLIKMLEDNNPNIHKKQMTLYEILLSVYKDICVIEKERKIGAYRVDYLINNKIVIECDELGHKDRNKKYEKEREAYLKSLGYIVIRFNPDDSNANVFELLNKINKYLYGGEYLVLYNILEKVKTPKFIKGTKLMNIKMLADYYKVSVEDIQKIIKNNDEFSYIIDISDKKNILFSEKDILKMAMFLDGDVAMKVRNKILDIYEASNNQTITKEDRLLLNIIYSDTEESKLKALREYKKYKNMI